MSNFKVGTITFKVLVNSEDFAETVRNLQYRITTHPTVVDFGVTAVHFNQKLIEAVESGNYTNGSMFKEEYQTTVNSFGDFDFSVKVEG